MRKGSGVVPLGEVVATVNAFLTVGSSHTRRDHSYWTQSRRQSKDRSAPKEEPTVTKAVTVATRYVEFMKSGSGPALLGQKIRKSYQVLFESALKPQNESDDELKKLFNIHSGGGDKALRLQIQTFKALCEYANFSGANTSTQAGATGDSAADRRPASPIRGTPQLPPVQVDLHIHLPENKTTRDYEAIIQDIAKYIYGRNTE